MGDDHLICLSLRMICASGRGAFNSRPISHEEKKEVPPVVNGDWLFMRDGWEPLMRRAARKRETARSTSWDISDPNCATIFAGRQKLAPTLAKGHSLIGKRECRVHRLGSQSGRYVFLFFLFGRAFMASFFFAGKYEVGREQISSGCVHLSGTATYKNESNSAASWWSS